MNNKEKERGAQDAEGLHKKCGGSMSPLSRLIIDRGFRNKYH